jgi:type II secretory pathway component PulM
MAAQSKRIENIIAALERLSPREKYMVGGVAITFVLFVGFLVWLWVSSSLGSLERRITDKTGQLKIILDLRQEFEQAKRDQKRSEDRIRKARNIQLMGTLEQLAQQIGINTSDLEMNPRGTASKPEDRIDEEKVEVNLQKITIDRLIEFLERVEQKSETIAVRTLHIRKNFQDPSVMDVGFTVSKFQLKQEKPAPASKGAPTKK